MDRRTGKDKLLFSLWPHDEGYVHFPHEQVSQGQPTEAPAKTIQKRTTAQPERGVMAGAKILIFHTGVYLLEMVSSKFISVEISEVTAARFDGSLDFAL